MSFFSVLSFFFKLREREWYIKFGYKEKWSQSYLSYFFDGVPWRIFLLLRANRLYAIFNTGLKKMASSCLADIFLSSSPGVLGFLVLSPTNLVQRLTFSFRFFRWREEGATSVLGSQPITWLLSSSLWSGDFLGLLDVTQVRLLSTDSLP